MPRTDSPHGNQGAGRRSSPLRARTAALLDLEQPWQVLYRGGPYLLSPQTYYECVGDVPNVAFPCTALYDPPTGRIAIYYGAADTVTALAFARIDEVLDFVKTTSG